MSGDGTSMRGVAASLTAATLFASMFFISGVLDGTSSEYVFAWRIFAIVLCYGLMLLHPAARAALAQYWAALTSTRWRPLLLLVLAPLVGFQLWLFAWAPMHGHALGISLGYLLLPITLVFAGRFALSNAVTRMQWVAVGLAAIAVAYKLALSPVVSWTTFGVCLGYPLYFILRQRSGLDSPAALGVEMTALLPVGVLLTATAGLSTTGTSGHIGAIVIGLMGAAAMAAHLGASRLLPLPLFGLLGYVEPVLLVIVAVILGERVHGPDLVVYGLLAVALTLLGIEGYRRAVAHNRSRQTPEPVSTTRA